MSGPFLQKSTPEELEWQASQVALCSAPRVGAGDLRNWEEVLMDSARNPLAVMEVETQQRNDCLGNSAANQEEFRYWRRTGVMPKLSEIYAYNASEYKMRPDQVGRDQGTSIHSGARLLIEGIPTLSVAPGLPMESDWPYSQYCKSRREFESRAKAVAITPSLAVEVRDPPPFLDMLALTAAGSTLHQGTYWRPSYRQNRVDGKLVVNQFPRGGGGHATAGIWGKRTNSGWLLAVWNSHGDGWYWVDETEYERLRKTKWEPFGAYVLQPENVVEVYDRVTSGGGYFA